MEEQAKRFGSDHLYAADTFIEMRPPSDDPKYLADLARAVYKGMAQSDPQAIWVLQGWLFVNNPGFWKPPQARAMFAAVPDERMIVLDLMCEQTPTWNKTEAFYGKPWLWCNIQVFGSTIHLSGALQKIGLDLPAIRRQPESGKLSGLGFVNEGLGYNPVVYDLMFEMAWRDQSINLEEWLADYALNRYGKQNEHARRAWQILGQTVYNGTYRTRSVIDQIPHQKKTAGVPYDNAQLAQAWRAFLAAADELGDVDTFRFDLVNVARQVLSNHAAVLHRAIIEAYQEKDGGMFIKKSIQFLQLIQDMDELLATREEFLLGHWLEDAKRWGTTEAERARFEWNARRVLTLWGEGPAIDDYARKEWSGLLDGYYYKRWQKYLLALKQPLRTGESFDEEAFNKQLRQWMSDWSNQRENYPSEPRGDSIQVARKLWSKYGRQFGT
jgi:alpha-N-acetylglucosaminidase